MDWIRPEAFVVDVGISNVDVMPDSLVTRLTCWRRRLRSCRTVNSAEFEDGAVLLLSSVGAPYSELAPKDILASLDALHENGILHGDARLENVVCVCVWPGSLVGLILPSRNLCAGQ